MTPSTFDNELVTGYRINQPIPERSQLFSLPPAEFPEEQREGLISLLVRTCGAHSLNPRRVVAEVLGKQKPELQPLAYPKFFNRLAGTINSHGKYASLFVSALEALTGQQGLSRLTLLPWQDFFPKKGPGMLSPTPRWCSACLLEQGRSRDDVFFPLLWSLDAYRQCTIHNRPLQDHCPHCGRLQPFLSRYPDQAICHHCLRSLIYPNPAFCNDKATGTQFELWVAKALGDMVVRQSTPGFEPSVEKFHEVMKSIVEATTDGNRAAFCQAIGFNRYALKNWLTKGERPSLPQFLALGYAVQAWPIDLAQGNSSFRPSLSAPMVPGKLKVRERGQDTDETNRAELRRRIQKDMQTEPPQPVSAIGKRYGVTASYLRYWFPDICLNISTRYKEFLRLRGKKRLNDQIQRVQDIVQAFHDQKSYPSRRKVDLILRKEKASLRERVVRDAYRAVRVV